MSEDPAASSPAPEGRTIRSAEVTDAAVAQLFSRAPFVGVHRHLARDLVETHNASTALSPRLAEAIVWLRQRYFAERGSCPFSDWSPEAHNCSQDITCRPSQQHRRLDRE